MTSLLPKSSSEFSKTQYWDAFFKLRGASNTFEWYGEYPELCSYLHKYMKTKDNILVVGCGNSRISEHLYDLGYRSINNIDISRLVIKQMKSSNATKRPELVYLEMDATNMTYGSELFTVVFDKGTLDALMPNEEDSTIVRVEKYLNEIDRVLRIGGRYIVISLLQEHIMNYLLNHFNEKGWMIRICRCLEVEARAYQERQHKPLPVFLCIFTKFKKMSSAGSICELFFGEGVTRVSGIEIIKKSVLDSQTVAMVCAGLQISTTEGQEVEFEVENPGEGSARYTVKVVEKHKVKLPTMTYAAFIVPQGRESEWAFGTPEGRQFLRGESEVDRLAIIYLNRGHDFASIEQVKSELSPIVQDFKPKEYKRPVLYLSLGGTVGVREELYCGESPISGKYIIEETLVEKEGLLRRLYFLSCKNAIQSEAKVRRVKTRKGLEMTHVDTTSLSCSHHGYMIIGAYTVLQGSSEAQLLVIGLGGGALCTFLKKTFTKSVITAIELDPEIVSVAVNFFGLNQDKQLLVYIKDGLDYLKESEKRGSTFDVIMYDVDNKDVTTGLISPPSSFITKEVLKRVKKLLTPKGIFILNFVCRVKSIRTELYTTLRSLYKNVKGLKLDDDLNEIIYCWNQKKIDPPSAIFNSYSALNVVLKQRKLDKLPCAEVANIKSLLQPD